MYLTREEETITAIAIPSDEGAEILVPAEKNGETPAPPAEAHVEGKSQETAHDTETPTIAEGMVIGRYCLEALLGRGGMAEVWRARHCVNNSPAAVKFLHPRLAADPTERARLDAEIMIAAALSHPNILQIYDVSEADAPQPYFVAELLEGRSMTAFLRETAPRAVPLARALPLLEQIADALDYAHAQGVVHRDIKPGNLLLVSQPDMEGNKNGQNNAPPLVKVLDFGIATLQGRDESALHRPGSIVGTPDYIAPEQASGLPVDGRTDQYALAVLAFRLLVGILPFPRYPQEEPFQVALRHIQQPPPDPRKLAPHLTDSVCDALLRALSKDPADRFPNCAAFVEALDADTPKPGTENAPCRTSVWQRFWPMVKRTMDGTPRSGLHVPLVVAADGSGDCTTLTEALKAAPSGATVLVRPGQYREAIRLTRSVILRTDGVDEKGEAASIVWEEPGRPTVYVAVPDSDYCVEIHGLTIRNAAPRLPQPLLTVTGGDRVALYHSSPGVSAKGRLRVSTGTLDSDHGAAAVLSADTEIENAVISGEECGLLIREGTFDLRRSRVTSSLGTGLRFTGAAGDALVETVTIHYCGGDGVAVESVQEGANLLLRDCIIEKCRFVGVATEPLLSDALSSGPKPSLHIEGGRITGNRIDIEDHQRIVRTRNVQLDKEE